MKLKDYACQLGGGYLDQDVGDNEIDMAVAFCYDIDEDLTDPYFQFLEILAENVEVIRQGSWCLICDFSGFAKKYNDKIAEVLKEYYEPDSFEFDVEEEAYYDFVLLLEGLIAGYTSEDMYAVWNSVFK